MAITLKKGHPMSRFAPIIIEVTKENALEMIQNKESLRQVSFSRDRNKGNFWLSTDPNLIIVEETVEINGQNFFLGLFKK